MNRRRGIGGYLYWGEVAREQGFLGIGRRTRKQPVRDHVGRDPAEQQDQKSQGEEPPVSEAGSFRVVEFRPRHDDANVEESSVVEERGDGRVDGIVSVLALLLVDAIPVECIAGGEAGEKVFRVDGAGCAENEELAVCQ